MAKIESNHVREKRQIYAAVIAVVLTVIVGSSVQTGSSENTAAANTVDSVATDSVEKVVLIDRLEETVPEEAVPEETPVVTTVTEEETEETPWSDKDAQIMALTLAGECYEDKETDKRLVCEVILNRVSTGTWGDTIYDVVSYPDQFDGYWAQGRDVSENDVAIAEQTLADWYANDCEPLSEYLFFKSGENRENSFRAEY